MLISEGRDVFLAVSGLVASIFVGWSIRRTPAVILTVAATLSLIFWGVSFATALRHTDGTFFDIRPWTLTHSILFWHAFVEPGVRCLLAGVGLACGIAGITASKKTTDAEHAPPAGRGEAPRP